jgi:hypothetical protein
VSFRFIVLVLHQCHRYQSFVLQIAICWLEIDKQEQAKVGGSSN